jgi:ABC-type antimicrobial peptide transport system permease subunit
VAERTREFGIRLALGATVVQTVRSVALSGVTMSIVGAVIGGGLSVLSVRLVQTFLWGVGEHDPITYIGVAGFLLLVSVVASVLPALKIARLDPAKTLRQ